MPPKVAKTANVGGDTIESKKITNAAICGIPSPGPKYKLKTLVGHEDHCISKYRNPAYTFGIRRMPEDTCKGPGPKYMLPEEKLKGFTHGFLLKTTDKTCGPGPKYFIPSPPSGPMFSLGWRTKYRSDCASPGPYDIKNIFPGPSFTIGVRLPDLKCIGGPGPSGMYTLDVIKPRSPMFSLGFLHPDKDICKSPGPKYDPKLLDLSPKFSFGMKHSVCAPPYIVECDDKC
ncbi:outer dense fiber protein 3-like [Vespa crabro]|uniref:outer dense fiber protein 3-like n=1 Tax=Vespa crabro TaxID=7445 RepID=UPI001F006F57|nr:outer dense fiber protein 3-like [Vespa crabro]